MSDPMLIPSPNPTWNVRHLMAAEALEPIQRDTPRIRGEEEAVRRAASERSTGGSIYRKGKPTLNYFIYTDLSGEDHTYVGHEAVHFYPPFRDRVPSGLRRPQEFAEFIRENPDAFKKWNASIKRELKKNPDCRCVFNGGSWHLNLQECLCKGDTLESAEAKAYELLEGRRLF